ncbi:unnamed protein product [Caenorhabditis bovis]|uniref:Dynactin subunit 6 n=1 Tax=Caenorhabditis bovis TaxID=2654633 RepID=A0A8S1FFP5_9PELO|nr:unnamed protein product [Caenorhabditis bovis]
MADEKIVIASTAVVCAEAKIDGEVTIGEGCVVHPYVTFNATKGPIIIGDNNLFEEHCVIENTTEGQPMIIGDSNVFQVKSECRAKYVGSRNVIGIRAQLGDGCFIADNCAIAIDGRIGARETIESFVSVYGTLNEHRKTAVTNMPTNIQLDLMRKLLPSYHHMYGRKRATAT